MANTDETKTTAASAQADAVETPSASSGKSTLRRKVVGRGQTSLSSPSPLVLPSEGQPVPNMSMTDAPVPSILDALEPAAAEIPAAELTATELPAFEVPAADAPSVELVSPAPVDETAAAKRGVGRPRKVPVAASSFSEAVSAVEPEAIKPAKVEVAIDETAPAELAEAEIPVAHPAASPSVSPTESPAATTPEPELPKPITTPNPTQSPVSSIKDKTMDKSANFNGFQGAMTEAQAKAQAAFEKSSTMLNEAGDFAKGNVEAMIESSKIFAEGVQSMGSSMVAEGRTAFETMTGDIKELAAVKSPTDFFRLQSELVRKSFDNAVAQSSKNTETLLKLMSDALAPVSGRVSLAVEKARQVAPLNATPASTTVDA